MKFFTRFSPPPAVPSPSGDAVIFDHEVKLDSDGIPHLRHSDRRKFLYQMIQESGDLATPKAVFDRCQINGDLTKLADPATAEFIDTVGMPKSLIEFSQFERQAEEHFQNLPEAVKREYRGSFMQFGQDLISGAFNEKFEIRDGSIAKRGAFAPQMKPTKRSQPVAQPAAQPAAQPVAQPQSVTINGITYTQEVMKI